MTNETKYKYYAFISYSSKDIKWGKRLHKKLTQYRLPSILGSDKQKNRKPIRPVFFAPYDIQPGELPDELKGRINTSKFLIVICSPNSAQSDWVGREIKYFCSVNKKENVFCFIIDGEPNSSNPIKECYNPVLMEVGFVSPLGANINEKTYSFPFRKWNKERAYIQLVTKLLGVDFDVLWQNHKRLLIQQLLSIISGVMLLCSLFIAVIFYLRPINVDLLLYEQTSKNKFIPKISNIKIDVTIGEYHNIFSVADVDGKVVIRDIPRSYIGKIIKVNVMGENCLATDTSFNLKRSNNYIHLYRDSMYYGHIQFYLLDENLHRPIVNSKLLISKTETQSDNKGFVNCYIPIKLQRMKYVLKSYEFQINDSIIEPPFESKNRVILVKPR